MLTYCDTANTFLIPQKKTSARQGQRLGLFSLQVSTVFVFQEKGGAMWPCSHLITQIGARNCYVPVAAWTWPPSLFCLFICKLTAVWDSILAATTKTELLSLRQVFKRLQNIYSKQTTTTTKILKSSPRWRSNLKNSSIQEVRKENSDWVCSSSAPLPCIHQKGGWCFFLTQLLPSAHPNIWFAPPYRLHVLNLHFSSCLHCSPEQLGIALVGLGSGCSQLL